MKIFDKHEIQIKDGVDYLNNYLCNLGIKTSQIPLKGTGFYVLLPELIESREIYPHYDYFNPKSGRWRFYPIENDLVPKKIALFSAFNNISLKNFNSNLSIGGVLKPSKISKSYDENKKFDGFWEEISKDVDKSLAEIMIHGLLKDEVLLLTDFDSGEKLNIKGVESFEISKKIFYSLNSEIKVAVLAKLISSLTRPNAFIMMKITQNKLNKTNLIANLKNSSALVSLCFDGESYLIWER